ncbi:MAG TPA: TRAP transporter substrate-binding protein [Arenicellales bacterium]|nr:TRAP transporter substrate-binding protein [Arenicellales bacterium]
MKRRSFLAGGAAAGVAASTLSAPAIAQERHEFTMVTTWPKGLPGLGTSAERLASRLETMSEGRIKVNFYAAGELVPPFECFDAVVGDTADMMHAAPYYWQGNHPALNFMTAAPFGLTTIEHDAWMRYGGGQELWDEVYDQFGLKGWNAGNTTSQMGGWFPKKLESLDDIQGMNFRTAGLGGEAWRRVGMNVQTTPGGEIFQALQAGTLDAAEWVGPWNDLALGLYQIHKHYHYPSLIEPTAGLEFTVSKSRLSALPKDLQMIFEVAAQSENGLVTSEFYFQNKQALDTLISEHGVQLHRFPDDIIEGMGRASAEVVAEIAEHDDVSRRVVESLAAFRSDSVEWTTVAEQAFGQARGLDIPYPAS